MAESTTSSIIPCLFKVLATHAHVELLGQALHIAQKAHGIRSGLVDGTLYESAKIFVDGRSRRAGIDGGAQETVVSADQNASASLASKEALATESRRGSARVESEAGAKGQGQEGSFGPFDPLVMAVLAASPEPWRDPERVRRSRVELAVALARRGLQDPGALAAILDPWAREERSRPLRDDIERARRLLGQGSPSSIA